MKTVWKYLEKYRKESILAPAFKLMEALMDLLVPLIVAGILNSGVAGADRGIIWRNVGLLLLLAVLGILFSFTAQWFAARASVGTASDLRQALFDHIQSLSYAEFDRLGTDTLITRLTSDLNQVQNGLNLMLRLVLRSPFIVFGAMIMAFTIDVRCALIFAVAIPILLLVVFGIMLGSIPMFARAQRALDSLLGLVRENLTGVRVIRAFCREEEETAAFDEKNAMLTKLNERVGRLSALMNPLTYAIINLAAILLIREGAIRVNLGALQQGDVVALYNYMAQIVVELIKMASLIISINKFIACANRVEEVMKVKSSMEYPEHENGSAAEPVNKEMKNFSGNAVKASQDYREKEIAAEAEQAICFRNVSFAYENAGAEAVSDLTFSVKRGETLGIIGGTGSGKSTVVSLIARFYDATAGSIEIFDRDVRSYAEGELIEKIGMVPQKAVLFEGSIRENLCWGRKEAADEELWEALETAQAGEVVRGKAGGLEARIEQNGRNLSGGQRQRLTIARALVRKPEMLILDDSSSALDYATDLHLRQAIQKLPGSMTVVIVSQRAASVQAADHILVLDDGRAAGFGTHEELLKTCEIYQEICASQIQSSEGKGVRA